MPRQRSTSTTRNPFARLWPDAQVAEALAPHMLDLLLTTPDERQAIKNLRVLRKLLREVPVTRKLFGLAQARNPGRPPGITFAKTSGAGEYVLVGAVLADIRPCDLLRHLFTGPDPEEFRCGWSEDHSHFDFSKEQKPEDRRYRWLARLKEAIGPKIPSDHIDDLRRMDYKTRLDSVKPLLSLFCWPA
jgi:hypothetical protein